MARALTKGISGEPLGGHTVSSAVPHGSKCTRCGGLMVNSFYLDLLNSTGEMEIAAKRCVQCGEVVDSVILLNRQLRQDSMAIQLSGKTLPNNCVAEGR
jgi:dissimilatory sulfite reductase (desulfoviridin) alpha/beta subunit